MKCYLNTIGVLDNSDIVHSISFTKGLNIITGKSSTGKSALIEIFDYCMGCSEFTIPVGVITNVSKFYFIILELNEVFLVLARSKNSSSGFLKVESELPNLDDIDDSYFEDKYFQKMDTFKLVLGRYFGLNITDTDEDLEHRNYRYNNAKKERPSIRNIISYLLQHQNLIANKHSIFYRFDEKAKRDQTIEQFKIFNGYITQDYFILKQKIAEGEKKLKQLENKQQQIDQNKSDKELGLNSLLKGYYAVVGKPLFDKHIKVVLSEPAKYYDYLIELDAKPDSDSNEAVNQIKDYTFQRNKLIAEKRNNMIKINNINSSIEYANQYKNQINEIVETSGANIYQSNCPFCNTKNTELLNQANELEMSINWLNNELKKTPLLLDSFESNRKKLELEVKDIDLDIKKLGLEIDTLYQINEQLKKNRSLEKQAERIKLKIENVLSEIINESQSNYLKEIKLIKNELMELRKELKNKYNVENKLREAEAYINNTMNEIGSNLEFEESYHPINLKFSLDTFELWHQKKNERIYLRSMGSGANWLYSHLSLFLSLNKYFCSRGEKSLIPPILFLDQPTQVYFPTQVKDDENDFDAKKIKSKIGESNKVDEDIFAVTNMFNQIVIHCQKTFKETGIEPQIIVTDHADKLDLEDADFEKFVNGRRWRTRGFIKLSDEKVDDDSITS
ncbi:MAG: DUF3732 domain-containing protein [Rhodothermaceae bacterium]